MARQNFSPSRNDRNALVQLPDSADDLPDNVEINLDDDDPNNFTIIEEDDTPEDDRGRPLTYDPSIDDQTDDLRGRSKKDVTSRIKRLSFERETERRRGDTAERERDAAVQAARQAMAEAEALRQRVEQGGSALAESMLSRNEAAMAAAKQRMTKANDEGDSSAMADAQADIARLAAEEVAIKTRPTPPPPRQQQQPQQQQPQQQQQQPPQIAPNVVAWIARNPWFNKDSDKTNHAMALHAQLVARGVNPASEQYTQELDRGMEVAYGSNFSGGNSGGQEQRRDAPRPNANADSSRDSGNQNRRGTVTLTRSELSLAKRLGVTPQAYAEQKLRRERLDKGDGAR